MKKLIALTMLLLTVMSASVLGYELDLASISTDDLLSLKYDIEKEISERGDSFYNTVTPGKYLVGTDIISGWFTFSCISPDRGFTQMLLFENEEYYNNYESYAYLDGAPTNHGSYYIEPDAPASFEMKDGMILTISGDSVFINEAKHSWMPSNE